MPGLGSPTEELRHPAEIPLLISGTIVFIGLLGGVSAFGFVGLVLGPIVLVMAGSLIDALTRERKPPAQAAAE